MRKILSIVVCLINFLSWSQPPPPAYKPSNKEVELIDSLLIITSFEGNFIRTCKERIQLEGERREWARKTIEEKYNEIDFNDFKNDIFYGLFSSLSEDELRGLVTILKKINISTNDDVFFVISSHVMNNLDIFIENHYLKD